MIKNINLSITGIRRGDIESMLHLKRIALTCIFLQFIAAIFYLSCSLILPNSHTIAVICGILAILVSLTPIYYAFLNKQFTILFSCISAFNFAPIWFLYLEAVFPGYDAYLYSPPFYRMEAFFWVAMFQIFVNLFYTTLWKRISYTSIKTFSFINTLKISPSFYAVFTLLAFTIPLIGYYLYYGSVETLWIWLTAGRSERGQELVKEAVGGMGALMSPLTWLLQLTPMFGGIAYISATKKFKFLPILSLTLSILVIFIFFLTGSRGIMMSVAAPILFFIFYFNWHHGLKFWIPAALSLFLLIAVMEMQLRFRGNLLEVILNPDKAAKENKLQSITTFDPTKSHRDNNTYLLCLMIKGYPNKYNYEGFNHLFATILNPIPRAIWPDKPLMHGAPQDLAYQPKWIVDGPLFMGTTSLTYTVVGDAYLSKGLWGILVYGGIYGLLLLIFDGIIYYTREKQALAAGMLGVGVFLSFWGFRSFFALVSFIYPILILIIFMSFLAKFNKLKF